MTENWLHTGIDKTMLRKKFEVFEKLAFPSEPEEDSAYDLYTELIELDGHIAGLISSYLEDEKIKYELLDADNEFNDLLNDTQKDSAEVIEIVEYKKFLDELINMIKHIEGIA